MVLKQHSARTFYMYWLAGALFLLASSFNSFGQTVNSRDNHINMWHNRSAWTQNWVGIASPLNISGAQVNIFGYITNGFAGASADLSFTGATTKLVVEDTLRVHGNLSMYNGASLHIKPGGILIVHGNYLQDANVNFRNEGRAIFLTDWTSLGKTGSYSNTGSLYVNGVIAEGGHTTLYKPYSALATDSPLLYYFTQVKVISAVCSGNNHDTLVFSGAYRRIIRWESSHSFFRLDTTFIANQTDKQTYTNLSRTTSYRVYFETKPPMSRFEYSTGATIVVLEKSQGGSLSGPAAVCASANTGVINLSNALGGVVRWESSTDGFQTNITTVASGGESYTFTNLPVTTSFRAVVRNGSCSEAYSGIHTVTVSPASVGGVIAGSTEVCKDVNSGSLSLSAYTGSILRWERSTDGFASFTSLASTQEVLPYQNLGQTTSFRAVVKSGSCSEAYSDVATISVSTASVGGVIAGSTTVCKDVNSGSLSLSGYTGSILRWESSIDGFASSTAIASEGETITYQNLSKTTAFRAVVKSGVCGEAYSDVATISVSELKGGTLAGEQTVCRGDNAGELQLSGYTGNILRWERSTDGFVTATSITHTSAQYSFQNLTENTHFRAVIGNAVCKAIYSPVVQVSVETPPSAGQLLGAATVCANNNNGSLQLERFSGNIVRWERSTDNFASHVETIKHTAAELAYENLNQSTSYRVVVGTAFCSEVYSGLATIQVEAPSVGGVLSGGKRLKPAENEGSLQLQEHAGTILRWELSTDNFNQHVQHIAHTADLLTYQNIETETWYRVLVQNKECSPVYSATARLWLNKAPVALTDTFYVRAGENFTSSKSLLANDYDPDGDALLLNFGPEQTTTAGNRLHIEEDGYIYYEPRPGFLGTDSLQYRLCDVAGEASQCVYAWVVLIVEESVSAEKEVLVYQGVSPNGDGLNDTWVIDHIGQYPNNHVQLFDRYGVLVYEVKGYNNEDKAFIGKSNKGTTSGDGSLPDATYYYRIKLSTDLPALKGYVILNR